MKIFFFQCYVCDEMIWGKGFECLKCGTSIHRFCIKSVSENCNPSPSPHDIAEHHPSVWTFFKVSPSHTLIPSNSLFSIKFSNNIFDTDEYNNSAFELWVPLNDEFLIKGLLTTSNISRLLFVVFRFPCWWRFCFEVSISTLLGSWNTSTLSLLFCVWTSNRSFVRRIQWIWMCALWSNSTTLLLISFPSSPFLLWIYCFCSILWGSHWLCQFLNNLRTTS